LGRFCENVR